MPKPDVERKLPPVVDFDLYGHCVLCHHNMIRDEYIDGEMQTRLAAEHRMVKYLLNDGSQMNVTMCLECVNKLTDSQDEIDLVMKSVVRGWEIETSDLVASISKPMWTQQLKDDHMKKQSKKKIVVRVDKLEEDTFVKYIREYKNKNKKENNGPHS